MVKGLSSLLPIVSSTFDDSVLTELQMETEQEKKKNGNSRATETEIIEDIFEKPHFYYADLYHYPASSRCITETENSLQMVHLDISTPPPDPSFV